jgi:DNA-binding transcriptional regulator PaaX
LTKDILRLVAVGLAVGGTALMAPNTLQLIEYLQPTNRHERRKIWTAIRYLERRDRIRMEERDGTQYLLLTEKGRIQHNEDAIWEMSIRHPYRWDRKWRLVMFDLPSGPERVRKSFREKLEDFGFKLYQRSVFIYPYECHEEVNVVADWYGVRKHVRYVVATEIHDMRRFVKEFNLL